jgi:predicted ester cyclase
MSSPDAVVRRWFEEVWNNRRESAIDEMMPADAVSHGLGPQPLRGNAAFKPFFHAFTQAFTDLRVNVLRTVTEGDIVATHIHATGRHTGPGMGTPTNQSVAFDGIIIARVRGEQIVEGWNCIDFLTMYQQMGWVAAPVQPL